MAKLWKTSKAPVAVGPGQPPARRRGWLPFWLGLAIGFGSLVTLSLGVVLYLGFESARKNTFDLATDKIELWIEALEIRARQHLDPAREQTEFIAALIRDRRIDPADSVRFLDVLTGSLAAAPQIAGIAYLDRDYQMMRATRGNREVLSTRRDWSGDERTRTAVDAAAQREGPFWGELFEADGVTLLNLRAPVRRDGEYLGVIVAVVSIGELSQFIHALGELYSKNAFILFDRDKVLAHRNLVEWFPGLSDAKPLPFVAEIGDPILAQIWRGDERWPLMRPVAERLAEIDGHVLAFYGEEYLFLYRTLTGYGDAPWLIGTYFRVSDINEPVVRLLRFVQFGLLAIAVSLLLVVFFGYRMARRMRHLAAAAAHIQSFDIADIEPLPGSIIREFDDASRAFNAAVSGLRWFETYLPKSLVLRLIRQDAGEGVRSDERRLTVLFTDIAGFTQLSERTPAGEIAALLNEHFALLAECIEAEGGTIDKYIGDSVMAFWGAPEPQPDQAARACRAALAIAAAIDRDNAGRQARGDTPIHMRIGVHTGHAVVGNIGAPGRINYTIVGDTVNTANRLEALGKQFQIGDVSVLVSGATVAALEGTGDFRFHSVGRHGLRGREEDIEVFQLDT